MGRPQTRMTIRMVIAVVATLITCLALLATQLEFDRTDPHETIHHNRPHPRHATPRPRPLRVKGENVKLNIQNKLVATTDSPYVCVSLDWCVAAQPILLLPLRMSSATAMSPCRRQPSGRPGQPPSSGWTG